MYSVFVAIILPEVVSRLVFLVVLCYTAHTPHEGTRRDFLCGQSSIFFLPGELLLVDHLSYNEAICACNMFEYFMSDIPLSKILWGRIATFYPQKMSLVLVPLHSTL